MAAAAARVDRSRAAGDRLGPRAARRRRGRRRASSARLTRRCERAQALRRALRRQARASSTPPGLREAMQRARRDPRARRPRRHLRGAALLDRHRRPGQRRAAAARAGARRRRSRRRCCSSSSSGPRSTTSAPRSCSPTTASTSARHHLRTARRYRPHLLIEPEEKILTEKALTGARRVDAAVRGADLGDRGRAADGERAGRARASRSAGSSLPDREARRAAAEAVTAALAPGLRTRAFVLQHAARRQGGRRPPAPLPALARRAQPRQRGQRRVGAGARRRGARRATRSRSAGTG